ncbi:SymE family type I addiction module toxin [Chitinophaga agri]|uniref:Type I toxin-antitoxin system SymE family toxin n=1 Tax=Chitinophaga agri TaxID=2703787 RepID=A0A6B9Z829_9BACT|nr:SymE family type I addiction module toxin [Chitinophaga agri]QHS58029.1 type I toxin-antitoxin system SymE family toxin [Chitinophaga agri]QHS58035.1 type I toxin-antitoxin system SymE family toxin [Chitinophaga agri]
MSSGTKTIRHGKLHGQYQALANHWNRGRNVPWLNVRGLWLEDAGFRVGDPIEIIVSKGKLVIKKAAGDGDSGN